MKKTLRQILFLLAIFTIVCIAVILTLQTKSSAFAASEEDAVYFVDGAQTEEVAIKRGESISVTAEFAGKVYEPELILGGEDYKIDIDGNMLSLDVNSVVGGVLEVFLRLNTDGGIIELQKPLLLFPTLEDGLSIEHTMGENGYSVNGDFVYVEARVHMSGESVDVSLSDGDGIDYVLEKSGRDSYGNVEVETIAVTLLGENNSGTLKPFTLENGVNNLSIETYATNSVMSGGSGTSADPYLIANADDLFYLDGYDSNNETIYFKQVADIILDDTIPLQKKIFYGFYNGNGYKLTRKDNFVLYAAFCQTNRGTIQSLNIVYDGVINISVNAGGLAAYNYGTIKYCTVKVPQIDINNWGLSFLCTQNIFGGIVNSNEAGEISNCTVALALIAESYKIGGIAVYNYATIKNNTITLLINSKIFSSDMMIGGIVAQCLNTGIVISNKVEYMQMVFTDITTVNDSIQPRIGGWIGVDQNTNNLNILFNSIIKDKDGLKCFNISLPAGATAANETYINSLIGEDIN